MQRYNPANPFLPASFWGHQTHASCNPVQYGDARLGDFFDRRRVFGNIYKQPFLPWSNSEVPPDVRLGDSWDRRKCYGNIYKQRVYTPVTDALGNNSGRREDPPFYILSI
jgi:hypothetical protein